MAVTGPWVGSSAKAETGEAWMVQAGAKLRIGTPFWMSNMIGKTVFELIFRINYHNQGGGTGGTTIGFYQRGISINGAGNSANQPTLNISPVGEIGSLCANTAFAGSGTPYGLSILNGTGSRVKITIWKSNGQDQIETYWNSKSDLGGWARYRCENPDALSQYFFAREFEEFGAIAQWV